MGRWRCSGDRRSPAKVAGATHPPRHTSLLSPSEETTASLPHGTEEEEKEQEKHQFLVLGEQVLSVAPRHCRVVFVRIACLAPRAASGVSGTAVTLLRRVSMTQCSVLIVTVVLRIKCCVVAAAMSNYSVRNIYLLVRVLIAGVAKYVAHALPEKTCHNPRSRDCEYS